MCSVINAGKDQIMQKVEPFERQLANKLINCGERVKELETVLQWVLNHGLRVDAELQDDFDRRIEGEARRLMQNALINQQLN